MLAQNTKETKIKKERKKEFPLEGKYGTSSFNSSHEKIPRKRLEKCTLWTERQLQMELFDKLVFLLCI